VGAVDEAAADVDGRTIPALDAERSEADSGAGDIDDSVDGAYFVKMYLVERQIVDGGFGFAEELEGAEGECAGIGWEWRFVEDLANSRKIAAVLMLVFVLV
jgi:hypothetical protein